MTSDRRDNEQQGLESLYREAGDVEPDVGIDRGIRARARAATETPSRRGYAPWLGGLAPASVAVIAIALAVHQPPRQHADPPRAEQSSAESEPGRAALSDKAASSESPEAAAAPAPEPRAPAPALRVVPEREPETDAEQKRRPAATEQSRLMATGSRLQAPSADAAGAEERSRQSPDGPLGPPAGPEFDPEYTIELMRQLAADGELQHARELREKLQKIHPDVELPQDLRKALEKDDGE